RKNLQVFGEMDLLRPGEVDECLRNITLCGTLAELCSGAQLVIEAVSEKLDLKRSIFLDLERLCLPEAILCSNTSGICIGDICAPMNSKARVLGTHFWNPPHVMACVEIIKSPFTSPDVFETVVEIMRRIGKEPIRVLKDVPGFLGNRLQHALWREAISLVEKGIAEPEDIDRVVKHGFGLRLSFIGPFETADLAGLDLARDVHDYLLRELDTSSGPSPVLLKKIEEGSLGVKTGKGFYTWTPEEIQALIRNRDKAFLRIIQAVKKSRAEMAG
ncbi:MAG TPA: 3-hydroxyacyl-CoA dehydrogenase NAD-binding domain-containing protein, partial [Thermodesulfobacteriota bacterium]|nr:3-hydroxyacyl-CoA dehydrogenase NAD-binding domain-containing protein [Thermodesulfobacteriota bacterium]